MDAAYTASLGEQNMCYSLPELLKPGCLWVIRTPGVYRLSGRRMFIGYPDAGAEKLFLFLFRLQTVRNSKFSA